MAKKKKKRKKKGTLKAQLKLELIGLALVFLAIFGSGADIIKNGAVSKVLEAIFRFFLGYWYFIIPIVLFLVGMYLIIKRKWPHMYNKKWIGTYLIIIGLLLLTHSQLFQSAYAQAESYPPILKQTFQFYQEFLDNERNASYLGGGMLGAILYAIAFFLFSDIGAKITAFFLFIIGILIMSNLSASDLLVKTGKKLKSLFQKLNASYKEWRKEAKLRKEEEKQAQPDELPSISYAQEQDSIDEAIIDEPIEPVIVEDSYSTNNTEPTDEQEVTDEEDHTDETEGNLPMTEMENVDYELPPIDLLLMPKSSANKKDRASIQRVVKKLESTFHSFGVKARVTKVHVGPSVTKFEVYPEAGVKVSRIVNLHDDLALALAAKDIRIEAPIPGKSAVGIEVPNEETALVTLREVLDAKSQTKNKLAFALGKDISGDSVVGELNKMPHLLVAGATGSGKSVCINGIITSILMRTKPHEVKLMMIDPKKVELNVYNGIPHLLTPVVTDPKKASRALQKVVAEMERRYDLFSETGTRNIEGYNNYITRINNEEEEEQPLLPYVVVIVDELADLMMVASSDVEDAITRLAQMARAAGIHLIIATQRPSVDVITGVIKANIPSRIAFSVSSQTDSRTILDTGGAEKLLGRGDMLFLPVGLSKPVRIQGAFLSDEEVERVVDHCIEQQKANYQEDMIPEEVTEQMDEVEDELFEEAVQMIIEMQTASVSMLQRRFRIGYTRAARLIDAMEQRGIVGPYEGSKPRTVLVGSEEQLTNNG
ncbi:S-DNA-T family DNA segregation ATPase FtsK/SpoIIIE [Gracilibacillus halotolerans]|uniref:S-DNA-T family DNA segregation ATPase FtsK/SpoIIIE n=1 Tax=Gracilibacillus halotolerans TaxID=74386 RepID=A0A841RJ31_9BACI|nr:S-DNA-T family DNA segregation ATPase FtsK/SpoIIIE [Gracilibacillus halotolerans]